MYRFPRFSFYISIYFYFNLHRVRGIYRAILFEMKNTCAFRNLLFFSYRAFDESTLNSCTKERSLSYLSVELLLDNVKQNFLELIFNNTCRLGTCYCFQFSCLCKSIGFTTTNNNSLLVYLCILKNLCRDKNCIGSTYKYLWLQNTNYGTMTRAALGVDCDYRGYKACFHSVIPRPEPVCQLKQTEKETSHDFVARFLLFLFLLQNYFCYLLLANLK